MENVNVAAVRDEALLTSLKKLVLEITHVGLTPEQVADTADLFNDCGLDSTSVVDLVIAIEEMFNVSIDEEELDVRTFQNLQVLAQLVEQKRQA